MAAPNIFIHIPKTAGKSINSIPDVTRYAQVVKGIGHNTAQQVRDYLGKENFDSKFSFAIVRNPYSRFVSCYHYFSQISKCNFGKSLCRQYPTFRKFCLAFSREKYEQKKQHFRVQKEFITDDSGIQIVDFIGRFEELDDAWKHIRQMTGIAAELPHKNASKHTEWQKYYDEACRKIVFNAYQEDFEYFNYPENF